MYGHEKYETFPKHTYNKHEWNFSIIKYSDNGLFLFQNSPVDTTKGPIEMRKSPLYSPIDTKSSEGHIEMRTS